MKKKSTILTRLTITCWILDFQICPQLVMVHLRCSIMANTIQQWERWAMRRVRWESQGAATVVLKRKVLNQDKRPRESILWGKRVHVVLRSYLLVYRIWAIYLKKRLALNAMRLSSKTQPWDYLDNLSKEGTVTVRTISIFSATWMIPLSYFKDSCLLFKNSWKTTVFHLRSTLAQKETTRRTDNYARNSELLSWRSQSMWAMLNT